MPRFHWLFAALFIVLFSASDMVHAQTEFASEEQNGSDDGVGAVFGRVTLLREALAEGQRDLLRDLSSGGISAPRSVPADHPIISKLRAQLRAEVLVSNQLVSGQVDQALRNATVRFILAQINAYEAAYGRGDGAFTTRWNVLSSADLQTYEKRLETRLRALLTEAAALPDASLERSVQGSIQELRGELEALRSEKANRAIKPPKLVSLAEAPTARNVATALNNLEKASASRAAERALFVEVERRMVWSVDNRADQVALNRVRKALMKGPYGDHYKALVRTGSVWRSGWPPRRGPPPGFSAPGFPPNPPPVGRSGGGAAVRSVSEGVLLEVDAILNRDPIGRASAAAQWRGAVTWLSDVNALDSKGWNAALSALSEADLKTVHDRLLEWQTELSRSVATQAQPEWWIEAEKARVDERLKAIASEITIRGPPPPGPDKGPRGSTAMQRATDASFANSRSAVSFESYQSAQLDRLRLVELERQLATAPQAERAAIREAMARQEPLVRRAQARRLTLARTAIDGDLRQTFINARGTESVVQAAQLQAARQSLPKGVGADHPLFVGDMTATLDRVGTLSRTATAPHINISGARVPVSSAETTLRFDSRFTLQDLNSAQEFRLNPIRAPGGVIVDVRLPSSVESRLENVRYDASTRHLEVKLEGHWLAIEGEIGGDIVRAAYGFVLDQRVTAVDIGSYDRDVSDWLIKSGLLDIFALRSSDREDLLRVPELFQVVRINPALANTEIGSELILADELIFQIVHLDRTLLSSQTVFRGIDTLGLHAELLADEAEFGPVDVGYKSILMVDQVEVTEGGGILAIAPQLDFAVYKDGKRFRRVSAWLNDQSEALRERAPELGDLELFAAAVAVFRSAVARDLTDGLDGLALVHLPAMPTPSLLCRSALSLECDRPLFAMLTRIDTD